MTSINKEKYKIYKSLIKAKGNCIKENIFCLSDTCDQIINCPFWGQCSNVSREDKVKISKKEIEKLNLSILLEEIYNI